MGRMRAFRFVTLLTMLLAGCGSPASGGTISGQIFVATQGGTSFKLGAVEVRLYPYDATAETLVQRRREIQKMSDERTELLQIAGRSDNTTHIDAYLRSGLIYFEVLGEPLLSVHTDADGKYAVVPPYSGRFIVAARTERHAFDSVETYCWLQTVDVDGDQVLNLANNSMTDSGDKLSIIQTGGSNDESYAALGKKQLAELWKSVAATENEREGVRKHAEAERQQRKESYIKDHFTDLVKASQVRALKIHPDLAVAGSDFNKKFVAQYTEMEAKKDPLLSDPFWPERIAGDTPPELDIPAPVPALSAASPSETPPVVAGWRTPVPPYPVQARMSHVQGTTTVRITTDASGNVSICVIVKSAGSSILDSSTQGYVIHNWKGPPNSSHDTTFDYRLQ